MKERGSSAFPYDAVYDDGGYVTEFGHCGMSLRDYFAAKAMHAYISKIPLHDAEGELGKKTTRENNTKLQNDIAESAYWMADAMLRYRKNEFE